VGVAVAVGASVLEAVDFLAEKAVLAEYSHPFVM
jgi:hypothetical protein